MIIKKTLLASVFLLYSYAMFSTKAEDDLDIMDKELMAKFVGVIYKCFKNADWDTCGEMLTIKYDITQEKYKKCSCHMACVGEELGVLNSQGQPDHPKIQEYVNKIKHEEIKGQLQHIYDKCNTVKGSDKCDFSEKYAVCTFKESPKMKEKLVMFFETLKKMKP